MNIIYMHTHDTGRYIQPYGYAIPTPQLMKLAQEGVLFRQAFNAGPTCSPSRAALLTGMAPHSCGMIGLAHRGFQLNDYNQHLVAYLNRHNYETVLCGVQHEAKNEETIGYSRLLHDRKNRGNTAWDLNNAEKAAEFIRERPKDKPFFLSFGMFSTHRVFPETADSIDPDYVMPPFPLADTPENREDMAAYMTSAMVADRCAGIVLDAVKEAGLEQETMIIFTTDHGIAFPKMKCQLYDTGIGVSLIIKCPQISGGSKVVDALVSHIDLFPTICDVVQQPKPDWLQGRSLIPLMNGEAEQIRDEIFSEVSYHAAYEPMRCIRTKRFKLIKLFDNRAQPVPANIDDGPSKTFLVENGFLSESRDREQLFDLYLDPVERVNLIGDSRYAQVYEELKDRLSQWMEETGDPLLKGRVQKPEGAVVNIVDSLSPSEKNYE